MKYRRSGNSDLELSELSFGTGDNAGLMVQGSPEARLEAVRNALQMGINHFDAAADYGKGRAELHLGEALRSLGAVAHITTKIEIRAEHLADIASNVVSLANESLARLGLSQVDVLQIHNAPAASREFSGFDWPSLSVEEFLGPRGAVEGLNRLRDQRKVRHFGFNCEHAEVAAAQALLDSGAFTAINVWFNLLNPTAGIEAPTGLQVDFDYGGLIDYAAARGVGCAVIRPLSGGVLTGQALSSGGRHPLAGGALSRHPERFQAELNRAAQFGYLERDPQRTLVQAAYQFILGHRGVTTVIGGFSDSAQIAEAVAAVSAPPLSDSDLEQVRQVWARNFAPVLG